MNDQITILETERLRLKRIEYTDVSVLIDLWCDPEATKYMGGPRDSFKLKALFEEDIKEPFAASYDLWPVVEIHTNENIGHCGLLKKEVDEKTEIELIYIFCPSAWGKGYATEMGQALKQYAFEKMKIERLVALIDPENEASERVAIKIGMQFEKEIVRSTGIIRKVYMVNKA